MTEAGKLFLLDRENAAGFDVDVLNHAFAMQGVAKRHVIDAGLDAGDFQALVMIDAVVLVVFSLILAPFVFSRGRQLQTGDGCSRQIPEADAFSFRSIRDIRQDEYYYKSYKKTEHFHFTFDDVNSLARAERLVT